MPVTVTAKFRCTRKVVQDHASPSGPANKSKYGQQTEVYFTPVCGPENAPWSEATPSGELRMGITNQAAVDAFEVGKDYFLHFTLAGE